MTKKEIAIIGKEFNENYYNKYHEKVIKVYKYCGEVRQREVLELTKEGVAIMNGEALNSKVFCCPCCHKKVSYNELEDWLGDIEEIANDKVMCSLCYEEEMGEDL